MDNYLMMYLFGFANRMKEIELYKNHWGEDFCKQRYQKHHNDFNTKLKLLFKDVDWTNQTEETAESFFMTKLCTDEQIEKGDFPKECKNLYLFPVFMIDAIPEGTMVTNILGETFKFERATCDTDIRCGYLSFGIIVKD